MNMGKGDLKWVPNRSPIFKGENYVYWKEYVFVHLISVNKVFWVANKNKHFVPTSIIDGIEINKPQYWNDEETKQVSYDLKVIIY